MSQPRFHFEKRKSVADFLSENLPNQFLFRCLKANTSLPDETILAAFNEAYTICIDVLAEPDIHTSRSASFSEMASRASRSSVLAHCFVFFLLSFHEKAADLRRYLYNLRTMLEEAIPDIFHPVLMSVSALAPLYPASVSFLPSSAAAISAQPALNDTKQYVKIRNLMLRAEKLPNHDAEVVLQAVRGAIADESNDWDTILALEIKRISDRPERSPGQSIYHIRDGQITNVAKILRAVYDLRILLDDKGSYASNFEDMASAFFHFLNAQPKTSVYGILSEGKKAKEENYMAVFHNLTKHGQSFYYKDDATENIMEPVSKPSVKHYSQGEFLL